jgi:adenine C2-methylase RlmN of 23S rRNA A2503 and tRNA A37
MPKRRTLSPQSVWERDAVIDAFESAGVVKAEYHAVRLWGHLVRHPEDSWDDVSGLPRAAAEALDARFVKFTSKVSAVQRSGDDATLKLLLRFQDGLQAEAVVMRYDTACYGAGEGDDESVASTSGGVRSTLCVSSQVGCQMGCRFCATGAAASSSMAMASTFRLCWQAQPICS